MDDAVKKNKPTKGSTTPAVNPDSGRISSKSKAGADAAPANASAKPVRKTAPKVVVETNAAAVSVDTTAAKLAARPKPASAPASKAASKPALTPASKRAPTAASKPASAVASAAAPKPAATPASKPATAVASKPAERKAKLIRGSFNVPKDEYAALAELKQTCRQQGVDVKKSELLRVAITLLRQLDSARLGQMVAGLPATAARSKKKK